MTCETRTLAAALLAGAIACGAGEPASGDASGPRHLGEDEGGPSTVEALVDSLRGHGIPVRAIGISNPAWFAPQGFFFAMGGDHVQVFEYEDAVAARSDIGLVAASGDSVAGSTIRGDEPTRFYRRGRLIVLVQGENERLGDALEGLLGEPVAGP